MYIATKCNTGIYTIIFCAFQEEAVPILASFLRKNHRALRLSTLICLDVLVRNYGELLLSIMLASSDRKEVDTMLASSDKKEVETSMTVSVALFHAAQCKKHVPTFYSYATVAWLKAYNVAETIDKFFLC